MSRLRGAGGWGARLGVARVASGVCMRGVRDGSLRAGVGCRRRGATLGWRQDCRRAGAPACLWWGGAGCSLWRQFGSAVLAERVPHVCRYALATAY